MDELASLRAALSAAADRIAALEAALERPPPDAAPAAPPPPFRRFDDISSALAASGFIGFQDTLASFVVDASPQSNALAHLSQRNSLARLRAASENVEALLREEVLYPLLTAHVPHWVHATHRPASLNAGTKTAKSLFLPERRGVRAVAPPTLPSFTPLPWLCQPELLTVAAPFHPAFNGELKPVQHGLKMFDELATYCALGMLGALYRDVPAGCRRFYLSPPRAYGLAAFPHVGYLVALEWLGKLHASIVSQPFFLGSPEHDSAVAALPDHDYAGEIIDVVVEGVPVAVWPAEENVRARVTWSLEGGVDRPVFKLIPCDAFEAPFFMRLASTYGALAVAFDDGADPPPPSLSRAVLLFGAGEVCVQMPWIEGRDARAADLAVGGCAVFSVARALMWLARHALLYVDLRPPNVRVLPSGDAVLIDYDDVKPLAHAPASFAELVDLLVQENAPFALGEGRVGALPAIMSALEALW